MTDEVGSLHSTAVNYSVKRVYDILKEKEMSIDELCNKLGLSRAEVGGAILLLRSAYGFNVKVTSTDVYREDGGQIVLPKYKID